jgi:hypothetical protein
MLFSFAQGALHIGKSVSKKGIGSYTKNLELWCLVDQPEKIGIAFQ